MRQDEFVSSVQTIDDELAKRDLNDTRKPSITLKSLNKLRKMRELRRFEQVKEKDFLPIMYGSETEVVPSF